MKQSIKLVLVLNFGVCAALSFGGSIDQTQTCIDNTPAIAEKIKCIKSVQSIELIANKTLEAGIQQFEIMFSQPIDHSDPNSKLFSQKIVLLHRSESEPMVLQTSGYSIFGVRQTAIMSRYATNQIQVEHRFFATSTPSELDWKKLNIKQSAEDFHRITEEFKKIYTKSWVGTGASKGGMTSVFHRYFYPNDLDGTVADVAPLSFSTSDPRYIEFVENVGGDKYASCRLKLQNFQRMLLEGRDEIVPLIEGDFKFLGNSEIAFEHAIIESSFIFWQYLNPEDPKVGCAQIPEVSSPKILFDFLQEINPMSNYFDSGIETFSSYYFQAATELGNPGSSIKHLDHLLKFDFTIEQYVPKGVSHDYSNSSMRDIESWAASDAKNIVFVYGEFDPWSAGAYPKGKISNNIHQFIVKGGNHGSKFTALDSKQRSQAEAILSEWLKKKPIDPLLNPNKFDKFMNPLNAKKKKLEYLEDFEFKMRRTKHF